MSNNNKRQRTQEPVKPSSSPSVAPVVPVTIQTSLLSTAMRVRKSVASGYQLGDKLKPALAKPHPEVTSAPVEAPDTPQKDEIPSWLRPRQGLRQTTLDAFFAAKH
jgi:hypothetical protein